MKTDKKYQINFISSIWSKANILIKVAMFSTNSNDYVDWQFTNEEFLVGFQFENNQQNCLGRGAFGVAFKGNEMNQNGNEIEDDIAIKVIPFNDDKSWLKEIQTWMMIKHENVVQLKGFRNYNDKIYILMEYCNKGTLEKYINDGGFKKNDQLDYDKIMDFLKQTVNGLNAIHNAGIIHGDLHSDVSINNFITFK